MSMYERTVMMKRRERLCREVRMIRMIAAIIRIIRSSSHASGFAFNNVVLIVSDGCLLGSML